MNDTIIIKAPYASYRVKNLLFNSNGYRHCSKEEVELLMKIPQKLGIFKLTDGTIINSKKYRDKLKKKKQTK